MNAVSLTGSDTAQIDGTIITDMVDGNSFEITFPNDYSAVKRGKDGNVIFAKNEMGRVADVMLRVLLGGASDKYLLGRLQQWADPSTFSLLTGLFVKHVGDGKGNVQSKVYQCSAGTFQRAVDARTAAEGDTEQSVAVYRMRFGDAQVSIQ